LPNISREAASPPKKKNYSLFLMELA
jgi:hypothetical protein